MSEDQVSLLLARFDELIVAEHALGIVLCVLVGVIIGLLLNSRR